MLWDGVIGSFIAAIIGGLVALVVVRLTNRQQRNNAREGREIAAMAELVAATGGMLKRYRDPQAVEELLLVAEAAAVRWDIDSDVDELGLEVHAWPYLLANLALDVFKVRDDDAARSKAFEALSDAQAWLMVFITSWSKKTRRGRERSVKELVDKREEIESMRLAPTGESDEASADGAGL